MVRRKKFSDEYKREAVRLATQLGVTKSQVAQELGINANLLGRVGSSPQNCDIREAVLCSEEATKRGCG